MRGASVRRFLLATLSIAMILASLPLSGSLANANHSKISGTVKNSATGLPLANVCVAVGPPVQCFTYTNAAGMYVVDLGALAFPDPSTVDLHFLRNPGYTTKSFQTATGDAVTVNGALVKNVQMVPTGAPAPIPVITQPPFVAAPAVPPGAVVEVPAATPTVNIEQRIADFWKRVDALAAAALLSSDDLGQWALNVIERDATARISVAEFRASTATMQTSLDRAGLAATAIRPPAAGIEQRVADFWARVDALQPTAYLAAADLGNWAKNVIDRDSRARISVADFRTATAGMQAGIERAASAPR